MFGWDGWFTLAVLCCMFVVLLTDKAPADFTMLLALTVVMCAQIVTTAEGLEGFSSSAVLTVGVLYVVAAGINASGALEYFFNKVLGAPTSLAAAQMRLMLPVSLVSAFLNNTPVVAIMIPIVQSYARRIRQPVSQFFIPLSFASILGGTCTLIGTSTNLVVAGRYEETFSATLGLFDLGQVGVPVLVTGLSYIILFSPILLPGFEELEVRANKALGLENDAAGQSNVPPGIGSDFTVGCVVGRRSLVIGKAVDECGLRGVDGLYLTSIQRRGRMFNAVGPEFIIDEGDMLFFTGLIDEFPEFCRRNDFLIVTDANEDQHSQAGGVCDGAGDFSEDEGGMLSPPPTPGSPRFKGNEDMTSFNSLGETRGPIKMQDAFSFRPHRAKSNSLTFDCRIEKVIVRGDSFLVGRTAKEARFRRRYNAAIVSIYRAGEKTNAGGSLGRIPLEVGDVLLLVINNKFDWDAEDTKADLKPFVSESVAYQEAVDGIVTDQGDFLANNKDVDLEREFLIPMVVSASPKLLGARTLVGQTVEAAGLRGLPGLFLIAIEHEDGQVDHVVGSDAELRANDITWFAGERGALATLRRIPGLESPEDSQAGKINVKSMNRRLVECVLSLRSPMVGKTVREAKFRTLYEAAIVAVHRQGRRVLSKIGDIELQAGDVLVLDTGPNFVNKYRDDHNFLLVTEIDDSAPPRFDKFYIALTATLAMVISYLVASDYVTLFEPAVIASGIMIATNCLTAQRARSSISYDVLIIIAAAFGLSNALENTGVADTMGQGLVSLADITGTGFVGVLCAVYLAGFLISIVLANNATALLLFPIAITSAKDSCPAGTDETQCLKQMVFILMLSASSSFASPLGYQTNIMVLNWGNYVFRDFLKFGFPMQFWQMAFSVVFVVYIDYWYVSWALSFAFLIFAYLWRTMYERRNAKAKEAAEGDSPEKAIGSETIRVAPQVPNVDDKAISGKDLSVSTTNSGESDTASVGAENNNNTKTLSSNDASQTAGTEQLQGEGSKELPRVDALSVV